MGIKPNAKNEPDILGYEMKTGESVTTFVDKAPNSMFIGNTPIPKRRNAKPAMHTSQHAETLKRPHTNM